MIMEQKNGRNRLPEFHWLTKEEVVARQKPERPRRGGSGHSDPTADEAIARVYFWEMAKMKEEQDNGGSKKERTVRPDTARAKTAGEGSTGTDTVRPDTAESDADSASTEIEKGKKAKI